MTTPNVPYRIELTFEMPGSPEQVWDAIATSHGITSWFLPTEVEERVGGAITTHMGETDSPGTVTGWEPPRRFAYEEPEWAALAGHAGADVTPLATEFLVEAQSGGTCVVRVVSSAFGTGADWEQEFFDNMVGGWRPYFDRLRLYLAHYAGQTASPMAVEANLAASAATVQHQMRDAFGIGDPGTRVQIHELTGVVERIGEEDMLVHVLGPVPGFLAFLTIATGPDQTLAAVQGQFFAPDADAFVEREAPRWRAWLEGLAVPVRS